MLWGVFCIMLISVMIPKTHASFSNPRMLSTWDAMAGTPVIAVGGESTPALHAVFSQYQTSGDRDIYYSRRGSGSLYFSAIINLSQSAEHDSGEPIVLVGADQTNQIYAAWEERIDEELDIRNIQLIKSGDGGFNWGSAVSVSDSLGSGSTSYSVNGFVSNNADGNTVNLVWTGCKPGEDCETYFIRSTNGGSSFTSPRNVSNDNFESDQPTVITMGNNVYVAWEGVETVDGLNQQRIWFSRSTNNGLTFSTPMRVSNATTQECFPAIVIDGNNRIFISWHDQDTRQVYTARSTDDGANFDSPEERAEYNSNGALAFASCLASPMDNGTSLAFIQDGYLWLTKTINGGISWNSPATVTEATGQASIARKVNVGTTYIVYEKDFSVYFIEE
jgi:hypothetical protein